jgi:predicted permease
MRELFRRLHYLMNRRRFDRELAGDLEFHREMAERNGGRLGNSLRLREDAREAWGWMWIDRLGQDLRYALRMLRRSPGFTLAAVLTLAIGIGVNVAAFSFFEKAVLTPLPVRDPESIFRFQRLSPNSFSSDLPYPEMAFIRDHSKTLSAVLAQNDSRLAVEGEEKQLNAAFVTGNFFRELGAEFSMGRAPGDAQGDAQGDAPEVAISYGFWQRHFGGDPAVVGKTLRLNDRVATVSGVLTRTFTGLRSGAMDVWLPVTRQPDYVAGSRMLTDYGADGVQMWGRPVPGLSVGAVEAESKSLLAELRRTHRDEIHENEKLFGVPGAYITSPHGHNAGDGPQQDHEVMEVMSGMAALTLLILAVSCGNLGSLLMARGVARQREISIRASVGAGRGRLIRQLLTESLVLGLLGSVAGLGLAYAVLRVLMAVGQTPPWIHAAPDLRIVCFALATGFIAALLFGLTPALQLARQRTGAALMRTVLIGAQVAGSCILLIVSGLLVRALDKAVNANPGFRFEQVVVMSPSLGAHGYSAEKSSAYLNALRRRLLAVPGVEAVAFTDVPPLGGSITMSGFMINGLHVDIHTNRIDGEFFRTMGIPLLRGRTFRPGDSHAVIVGQSLAHKLWPNEDPLGKTLEKDTVVGVAGSARIVDREDGDGVEAYYPASPANMSNMSVLVKTAGPPRGLLPFLVSVSRSVDSALFPDTRMLQTSFREKLEGPQRGTFAVMVLGFVALLLACSGIVGLVSYGVSQRTKEIGLRMALGAGAPHVLAIVLSRISRPVAIGLVVGLCGAGLLAQLLRRQLYGLSTLDPLAYLAAVLVFGFAVSVAALLPARRALRVDPMRALRCD